MLAVLLFSAQSQPLGILNRNIVKKIVKKKKKKKKKKDRASQHMRLPTPQPPRAHGAGGCQPAHIKFKGHSSFSGDAKEFKEFAFAMDLGLKSLAFQDKRPGS